VSDQDAYAASGQKFSAQSIVFVHENWVMADLSKKLRIWLPGESWKI
jgi:1-pyrroline-5-carboxylate dehydrogenase